jgi:hypothetical protein
VGEGNFFIWDPHWGEILILHGLLPHKNIRITKTTKIKGPPTMVHKSSGYDA